VIVSLELCPDSSGLDQADEDANEEVQVLGSGVTWRSRERDATPAEVGIDGAFLAHHLGGNWAVKECDQQAQQESRDLDQHGINLSIAWPAGNR